jgi:hypothetical protein
VEVPGSHRSEKRVVETVRNTTHNKHKTGTSVTSGGFQTAISAIERIVAYTSDGRATGMGLNKYQAIRLNFHSIN